MGMENFAPAFRDPEHYITDITYKIWEERGINRIRDWYADTGPVRTPHGVTDTAGHVVAGTLATLQEFPDRLLLAEDIVIGDKSTGFYSSHRVRSTATHGGDGFFGPATGRRVTMLTIADCLCRDNQVVEEWLVRDQAGLARQLGVDPGALGRTRGTASPETYALDTDAWQARWDDPDNPCIEGDAAIAGRIVDIQHAIWNKADLNALRRGSDRALRFEGPAGALLYGQAPVLEVLAGILAAVPDGQFVPHHAIVRQDPERPVRVALRWSYCGQHRGDGRYGPATGCPVGILGISHYELRNGAILNEWMLVDEVAIHAQIAAHRA